ncbi:hypothetical protein NFI96_012212 [Prochilodus magdalenae]|nr:hypothetical protein NFI96_012212 [Prochilodus magdalenae]
MDPQVSDASTPIAVVSLDAEKGVRTAWNGDTYLSNGVWRTDEDHQIMKYYQLTPDTDLGLGAEPEYQAEGREQQSSRQSLIGLWALCGNTLRIQEGCIGVMMIAIIIITATITIITATIIITITISITISIIIVIAIIIITTTIITTISVSIITIIFYTCS